MNLLVVQLMENGSQYNPYRHNEDSLLCSVNLHIVTEECPCRLLILWTSFYKMKELGSSNLLNSNHFCKLLYDLYYVAVLFFGGAKSQLGVANLPLPLLDEAPPIAPIPTVHTIGKAGILCIDIHPKKR